MEPPPPPGLLVLGGQSGEGQLSSIETFGLDQCTIPPLPETRYDLGSFIAPTQPPRLTVCGGWWMGKPTSSDCLTLDVNSGQWERGTFTNGLLGEGVRGVINMEGQGVFVVHNTGISVLAHHSESWAAGPVFTASAECGCNISRTSFVTIHMNDTYNVREYTVTNHNAEPKPIDSWPSLLTRRRSPGCGATLHHLVVAGGVSGWDEVLASVEIFDIDTKALRKGGSLRQPRAYFQIIPIGSTQVRLLAVGGLGQSSTLATSEWWEEEEDSWEEGPALSANRSNFGALMAPPHLVCTKENPYSHSCPAVENDRKCLFTAGSGDLTTSTKSPDILTKSPYHPRILLRIGSL